MSNRERLENAFSAAEREFGVQRLLDPEDVDTENPDEKSLITYVSSLYEALPRHADLSKVSNVIIPAATPIPCLYSSASTQSPLFDQLVSEYYYLFIPISSFF